MAKALIFCLLVILTTAKQPKFELFFGQSVDDKYLYPLAKDFPPQDQYFVDIGGFDPIHASNCLRFYVDGWRGVNVQAHPKRFHSFLLQRPTDINVNYAIGQEDQYVTLFQNAKDGSASSISQDVTTKLNKTVSQQIKVPALTMGELCERYYVQRPTVMSLDIEGYGARALQGNNWEQEKCRPKIIISQQNRMNNASGFRNVSDILGQQNYTLLQTVVNNEIYIGAGENITKYQEILKAVKKNQKNVQEVRIKDILQDFKALLKIKSPYKIHYDPEQDSIDLFFSRKGQNVVISEVVERNFKMTNYKMLNRPTLVLFFNPLYSSIILDQKSLRKLQKINGKKFNFWKLEYASKEGKVNKIYFLIHDPSLPFQESIKFLDNPNYTLESGKPLNNNSSQQSQSMNSSNQFAVMITLQVLILLLLVFFRLRKPTLFKGEQIKEYETENEIEAKN